MDKNKYNNKHSNKHITVKSKYNHTRNSHHNYLKNNNKYDDYKNNEYKYGNKIINDYYDEMKEYFNKLENISEEQKTIHNNFLDFIKSYYNKIYKYKELYNYINVMFTNDTYTFETFNIMLNNTTDKNILINYKYILIKFNNIIKKYFNSKKINNKIINYIKLSIIFSYIYKIFVFDIKKDVIYQILQKYFI